MSQDIHYSSCILVYSFKNITYLIPKYTREGVSIHFLYSTHFKSSFLFYVQTIGIDIHAPIIAGVSNVSYSTSKHSAISCAILNLYLLIQLHCSVYDLLYTHLLIRCRTIYCGRKFHRRIHKSIRYNWRIIPTIYL